MRFAPPSSSSGRYGLTLALASSIDYPASSDEDDVDESDLSSDELLDSSSSASFSSSSVSSDEQHTSKPQGYKRKTKDTTTTTNRADTIPKSALGTPAHADELELYNARSKTAAWRTSHQHAQARSDALNLMLSKPDRMKKARKEADDDLDAIRGLLEGLKMERAEEERREREEFDNRNQKLWESIEHTIRETEELHLKALQAKNQEAERLASALRASEEAKRRAEVERNQAEQARQQAEVERKNAEETQGRKLKEKEEKKKAGEIWGSKAKANEWDSWVGKMQNIKQNILPKVNASPEWRKKCNAVKRQITPKVGQITNSQSHILSITSEISLILHSARSASPEIYTWILNHFSKILIKQAETEITAKPSAAFPLARLVVALMLMGHADGLGEVLASRLVKKSCWVVPFWPARKQGQSEADYDKSTGRLSSPETTLQYTLRQTGILTLYFTILHTLPSPSLLPPLPPSHPPYPPFDPSTIPSFFILPSGWLWVASLLKPALWAWEGTPTFLGAFMDVCASRMESMYGRQMSKLLRTVKREVDRERAAIASGSSGGGVGDKDGGSKRLGLERLALRLDEWERIGAWQDVDGGFKLDP